MTKFRYPPSTLCGKCGRDHEAHANSQCLFQSTAFVSADPKAGRTTSLMAVPTRRIERWLRTARSHRHFNSFQPRNWGRDFSIANLVAELSQRADRTPPKPRKKTPKW